MSNHDLTMDKKQNLSATLKRGVSAKNEVEDVGGEWTVD